MRRRRLGGGGGARYPQHDGMEGSVVCAAGSRKTRGGGPATAPPQRFSVRDVAARSGGLDDALDAYLVGGRSHRDVALLGAAADVAVAAADDLLELRVDLLLLPTHVLEVLASLEV